MGLNWGEIEVSKIQQNPAKSSKKNIFCFFVFMKKHHAVGEHGVVIGTT